LTIRPTYLIFQHKQKLKYIFTTCLVLFMISNVVLDYFYTLFQKSSFYISESVLFSSYWLLFIPIVSLLLKSIGKTEKSTLNLSLTSAAVMLHLIIYPALIWILSKTFYNHTFPYWQTFNFGISAYFIKTVIIYGCCLATYTILDNKNSQQPNNHQNNEGTSKQNFIKTIVVSDNNSKKLVLALNEVFYFSANPPYVNIHHLHKKYLYTETLKSLEDQLNDKEFVRIHKSHIVNLNKIVSIQSRQNGDYDVTLSDDTILRVSRNYATRFKSRFAKQHQLSTK
jgi:two-component system, LytTR family, response regulator LytT